MIIYFDWGTFLVGAQVHEGPGFSIWLGPFHFSFGEE